MKKPKLQPQGREWKKEIRDKIIRQIDIQREHLQGEPEGTFVDSLLEIVSQECQKAERIGFDRAMQGVPNPNYSEAEVQREREKAREGAIRECLGAWSKTKSKMEGKTADIDLITDLDVFEKTLKILLKK